MSSYLGVGREEVPSFGVEDNFSKSQYDSSLKLTGIYDQTIGRFQNDTKPTQKELDIQMVKDLP